MESKHTHVDDLRMAALISLNEAISEYEAVHDKSLKELANKMSTIDQNELTECMESYLRVTLVSMNKGADIDDILTKCSELEKSTEELSNLLKKYESDIKNQASQPPRRWDTNLPKSAFDQSVDKGLFNAFDLLMDNVAKIVIFDHELHETIRNMSSTDVILLRNCKFDARNLIKYAGDFDAKNAMPDKLLEHTFLSIKTLEIMSQLAVRYTHYKHERLFRQAMAVHEKLYEALHEKINIPSVKADINRLRIEQDMVYIRAENDYGKAFTIAKKMLASTTMIATKNNIAIDKEAIANNMAKQFLAQRM